MWMYVYISHRFFLGVYVNIKRHSVSHFFLGGILKVVGFPKDSH